MKATDKEPKHMFTRRAERVGVGLEGLEQVLITELLTGNKAGKTALRPL